MHSRPPPDVKRVESVDAAGCGSAPAGKASVKADGTRVDL